MVPLNRETTFRNRPVISSAISTAECSSQSLPLDIPIFDSADDVGFVGRTQLKFHFIPMLRFQVLQKQVKPSSPRLHALFVAKDEIARPRIEGSAAIRSCTHFSFNSGSVLATSAQALHNLLPSDIHLQFEGGTKVHPFNPQSVDLSHHFPRPLVSSCPLDAHARTRV